MPPTLLMEDEQLLAAWVRENDDRAFQTLARKYTSLVYGTAKRKTGRTDWAEEVVQEVLVLFARRGPKLSGKGGLAGWFHRSALLTSATRLRTENRYAGHLREFAECAATDDEASAGDIPHTDWSRLRSVLDDALAALPEMDRNVILLHYFERRNFGEVAVITGLRREAAKKRSLRALEKLRRALRRKNVTLPAAALGSGLLCAFQETAPAGVAAKAAAGVATATGTPAVSLIAFLLMKKTVIAALLIAFCGGLLLGFKLRDAPAVSSVAPDSSNLPSPTSPGSALPSPSSQPGAGGSAPSAGSGTGSLSSNLPDPPSGPGTGIGDVDPEAFRTHPRTVQGEARLNALKAGFRKLINVSRRKKETLTGQLAEKRLRAADTSLSDERRADAAKDVRSISSTLAYLEEREKKFSEDATEWLNAEVALQRRTIIAEIKQAQEAASAPVAPEVKTETPAASSEDSNFRQADQLMAAENYREAMEAFNGLAKASTGEIRDQAYWKAMLCAMVTGDKEAAAVASTKLARLSTPGAGCFAMAARAIQKDEWEEAQVWVDQAGESGTPGEVAAFGEDLVRLGWKQPDGNALIPPGL